MQVVGLFRELTREKLLRLPSIIDAKGTLPHDFVATAINFLKNGVPVFDVMEATPDVFETGNFVIGGPSLVSDGNWVWRQDLLHYVENYQVGLPAEFIAYVKKARGSPIDEQAIVARWEEALAAYEFAERG